MSLIEFVTKATGLIPRLWVSKIRTVFDTSICVLGSLCNEFPAFWKQKSSTILFRFYARWILVRTKLPEFKASRVNALLRRIWETCSFPRIICEIIVSVYYLLFFIDKFSVGWTSSKFLVDKH